jgi:type VI secretion system secreted protein VgrG
MTLDPGSALSTPFTFSLPNRPEAFSVASFRAHEEVSKLYRLDLQLTTDATDEALASSILGEAASLVMSDGGLPIRAIHGIVARAEGHGAFLNDRQGLRLTVVPAVWKLKRRRMRRIFQAQTTQDIATAILGEWGVANRFQVHRDLPVRGYCVQYDETDYAFLARLFAEEGLLFFFDHPFDPADATGEVLVVADTAGDYAPIDGDPQLRFERIQPGSAMKPQEDHVTWLVPRSRIRSANALVRGHDFRRPDIDLRDQAAGAASNGGSDLSTIYEHEGSYEDDLGPRPAAVRLDQQQKKSAVAEGTSFCRRLMPGRQFTLTGHDYTSLDRSSVVSRVEHEGYGAETIPQGRAIYQNRFVCTDAAVVLRPRYRPPRPRQVAETAVVVGPDG